MPDSDYASQAQARRTALAAIAQPPLTANTALQLMTGSVKGATGTVADATGLISTAVATSGSGLINNGPNETFTTTAFANTNAQAASFTTTRSQVVLVFWFATGKITSGTGNGQFQVIPNTQTTPFYVINVGTTSNFVTSSGSFSWVLPGAGTFAVTMQAAVDATPTTLTLSQYGVLMTPFGS